jgi:hypothetical protein
MNNYKHLHSYKRGEKQLLVLEMVKNQYGATYGEIIKYAFELSNGRGSFDKVGNRGYWSGIFRNETNGYFGRSNGYIGWGLTLFDKKYGKYYINQKGLKQIYELKNKFGY